MKIYNSYYRTNISFGYDKKLNSELEKNLESDKSGRGLIIRRLNAFCTSTEDLIVDAEKKQKKSFDISNWTSVLINVKSQLVDLVEKTFPSLNYREREIKHYELEGSKKNQKIDDYSDYWRFYLAGKLSRNCESPVSNNTIDSEEPSTVVGHIVEKDFNVLQEIDDKLLSIVSLLSTPKDNKESAKNEIVQQFIPTENSPKGFSSLGGMADVKQDLFDKIIYPIKNPEAARLDYEEYGKKIPRAILFYGPPGCGKTYITEALSQEADVPMFYLKISKAGSEFINKTSQNYEKAFDEVAEISKRNGKPSIMFIDEIDGLTKLRDSKTGDDSLKQIGTLLDLIAGARDRNIIVIAATNKFDIVDDAIKRRFDFQYYIGFPDKATRLAILQKILSAIPKAKKLVQNEKSMELIAEKTKGFSNDDLCVLTDYASSYARLDGRRDIALSDFEKAIVDNQGRKIKEQNYKSVSSRKPIGF